MKQTRFRIEFMNKVYLYKYAFSSEQAKILAQAERIQEGLNYDVIAVHMDKGELMNEPKLKLVKQLDSNVVKGRPCADCYFDEIHSPCIGRKDIDCITDEKGEDRVGYFIYVEDKNEATK